MGSQCKTLHLTHTADVFLWHSRIFPFPFLLETYLLKLPNSVSFYNLPSFTFSQLHPRGATEHILSLCASFNSLLNTEDRLELVFSEHEHLGATVMYFLPVHHNGCTGVLTTASPPPPPSLWQPLVVINMVFVFLFIYCMCFKVLCLTLTRSHSLAGRDASDTLKQQDSGRLLWFPNILVL